ncbi:MAG: ROK family protein [Peptoniphilaceae bacterium]|nr:ROK family protein [Peptoniphilaceae bacterium]MDY6085126.1 ROK family protein [Peptoniphilaceae bacterium]
MSVYIGVDLGGTTAKIGLFDAAGSMTSHVAFSTGREKGFVVIMREMSEQIRSILGENGFDDGDLSGIGIGVPGPVVRHRVVDGCVNLDWDVVDVAGALEENGFTCPIVVENDANVAALGEVWKGAAAGYASIVFVTIGTGIGGGIIVNHQIISGAHGAGGEIGHMPVFFDAFDFSCGCGGRHCLEQMCSAPNIVRVAGDVLEATDAPSALRHYNGGYDTRAIFDAARRGDGPAREVVSRVTQALGRGLAVVSAVVDPECIVIGGGVSHAEETLLEPLRNAYQSYAYPPTRQTPILKATLGNLAGMIGAVHLVLQE